MEKVVSKLFELDKIQHVCRVINAVKPADLQFEFSGFHDAQFLGDEITEGLDSIENYMKSVAISSKFEEIVLFALVFRNEKSSLLISVKENRRNRSFHSEQKVMIKAVFEDSPAFNFEKETLLINVRNILWNAFVMFNDRPKDDFEKDLRSIIHLSK
jgi:hypothetical protein